MKKLVFLPFFLLAVLSSFSQVNFEDLSFDQALQKAKQTGKLIFLQFESDGCNQCNEVANKALADKKLGELLQGTFVCIKISLGSPDRDEVATKYNKQDDAFGSLFISADGNLVHSYPGSTSYVKTYEEHIDKALTRSGEGMRVNDMIKQYRDGNKSPGFMELLMETKQMLKLETDSLLEEYVTMLPADSFKSERTLIFIAKMSPLVESKASVLMRKDYPLFLKAWQSMTTTERKDLNNITGDKSMKKAIAENNAQYAYNLALYMGRTYSNNPSYAQKVFESQMLDFYKGVNDTTNYLKRAASYYDKYFMTVVVDSIRRQDTMNMKKIFNQADVVTDKKDGKITNRREVKYAAITQFYMQWLNNAAKNFYEMTSDAVYLEKALQWSARANEFFPSHIAMNTHALLLYKTGQKEQAIEWQNKAILLKNKQGYDTKSLEAELADMKNGKSMISRSM